MGNQWSEAEIAQLRDLTGQGLAASVIGSMMGKTRNAIIGKWGRMGDKVPTRGRRGPPVWTPGKLEKLRKLWIGGYETRQIADELGMSLSAIHGKIQHVRPKHKNVFPHRQIHNKPHPKNKDAFTGVTVSFRDHRDSQCRYIPGDPNGADTLYCADERLDGLSYCLTHFELCTTAIARRSHRPFLVLHPNARLELTPE